MKPKTLKKHQQDALAYLSARFQGALLMEMRLGKNLAMIRHFKSQGIVNNRILFITQFGAMQSIEDELVDEGVPVTVLTGTRQKRLQLLTQSVIKKGWVVSNYESAERLQLHKQHWKALILDETIKIANPKGKVTKYFLSKAWAHVNMRFILNGKVNPESMFQICCQFLFLHGIYMGCKNFWSYRARYYIQTGDWEWVPKVGHKQAVYNYVRKHAFVLLRKDANIGPDKIYQKRIVEMNPEIKKAIKYLAKNFEINGVEYKNEMGVQIGMSYLASGIMPGEELELVNDNKLQELLNLIKNEVDGKVLVWCRFRAEQSYIHHRLTEHELPCIKIHGGMSKEQRRLVKSVFDEEEKVRVAVLTIASSCKGQDWSAADTSIYYSNEWSNDMRGQSEDRMVHLEKTEPVLIIDMITKDSVDENVTAALKTKEFDSNMIMSKFLSKYTKQ